MGHHIIHVFLHGLFLILGANQALISSTGLLQLGSAQQWFCPSAYLTENTTPLKPSNHSVTYVQIVHRM